MKIKTILIAFLATIIRIEALADYDLMTNVYTRINAVYEGQGTDPHSAFIAIRGGGFRVDGMSDRFMSLCELVSNRCDEIVAEWNLYETNEVARFTVQSAIGFSGFENQTNLAERVLAMFEGNPSMVSIDTLKRLRFPYGTPFESENYLALNFDAHGISNTVMRIKSALVSQGDTNAVDVCDEILSGARKEWLLDMKAAGAL